jgi:anti-sigma regulatory factor (Ser/Thr protein kinase)
VEVIGSMPDIQVCVPVTEESQPAAARRAAVALAHEAGLDEPTIGNVALVVTELATNLVKHAQGGELLMRRLGADGNEGIEVLSLDKGPGMSNLSLALEDGYSTAGSPGTGLGSVFRTARDFDIYSQPGKGTAVVARIRARRAGREEPYAKALGVVRQAKPGESVCGDNWIVRWSADAWLCAVVDGLGHGLIASQAATAIVDPWAGFVLAGAFAGTLLDGSRDQASERRLNVWFLLGGAALALAGYGLSFAPSLYENANFWTSSPAFFCMRVGILTLAMPFAFAWNQIAARGWSPLRQFGRTSLFVYWIHVEMAYGTISRALHRSLSIGQWAVAFVMFLLALLAISLAKDRLVSWWRQRAEPALAKS